MLALTNPDPALGLPAGTTLKPTIFLRNASAAASSAQVTFHWRSGTAIGKGTVSVSLDPHATSIVDVAALQANGTIPASAQWAYVSIVAPIKPDDLLAVATSFDETGKLGAQTPFTDQVSNHWAGGMWEVDPTHDTFIAVGNAGNSASKARITFYYNSGQGKYQIEQTLAPDEQVWLDIGKLIRNQVPDLKGSTVPVNIMSGSYELDNRTDKPTEGLFEGKLVVDKTYGYAVHGCALCCPETYNRHLVPNPLNLSVGGEASMSAVGTDDCSGKDVPLTALNWATVNYQVATASGHLIDATGAGSTTDSATVYYKGMRCSGLLQKLFADDQRDGEGAGANLFCRYKR